MKTILITGSTDGIGKLAAIKLAKDGHQVYLHGRNPQKLLRVVDEVKAASGNEQVKGFVADFSDLKAVKQLALQLQEELPKLDVLINNAGIFNSKIPKNQEGYDIRMVVNYLAPYVFTKALIPLLQKGENPRLINLSSAAQAPVSKAVLLGQTTTSERSAYAQSKLALTMWSFDLAKKLKGMSVIALNPGSLLNTKMVQEAFGQFWSSADKGANIIYDLAVAEEYEGVTNKYYDNDKGGFGRAHTNAYDQAAIAELLQLTEEILSK